VFAIAAGTAEELGYEIRTRAEASSIVAYYGCLAEMTRNGTAYDVAALTFLTLAGVDDLFLTCSSQMCRNFMVGCWGTVSSSIDDEILGILGSVAEVVATSKGAKAIIQIEHASVGVACRDRRDHTRTKQTRDSCRKYACGTKEFHTFVLLLLLSSLV
jgi:glycerol-3-phosphate dehydrogenase